MTNILMKKQRVIEGCVYNYIIQGLEVIFFDTHYCNNSSKKQLLFKEHITEV